MDMQALRKKAEEGLLKAQVAAVKTTNFIIVATSKVNDFVEEKQEQAGQVVADFIRKHQLEPYVLTGVKLKECYDKVTKDIKSSNPSHLI